jgi:hypothetical protein
LAAYDAIWSFAVLSANVWGDADRDRLLAYVQGGGNLFLISDNLGCCGGSVAQAVHIINTVTNGPDVAAAPGGSSPYTFNPEARGNVANTPNALTTWHPLAPGASQA